MGMGQIFTGDVITKIKNNPKIASYLDDPVFVNEIKDIQLNPQNVKKYFYIRLITKIHERHTYYDDCFKLNGYGFIHESR